MNKKEHIFFSYGCRKCGGFQLGGMEGGDMIPVFPSRIMAELAMSEGQDEEETAEQPPIIIEIGVRIL